MSRQPDKMPRTVDHSRPSCVTPRQREPRSCWRPTIPTGRSRSAHGGLSLPRAGSSPMGRRSRSVPGRRSWRWRICAYHALCAYMAWAKCRMVHMFFAHDTSATDVARRFDPRAKAVAYLCLSALVLLATRVYIALAICIVLVGLLVGLRLVRPWLRVFRVLLPTLLLLGVVVYWLDGPASALAALLRVLALVMAGGVFFLPPPPCGRGE